VVRRDLDLDRDGRITDAELAAATPPSAWQRFGLRGPAIVLRWFTRNAKRMAVLLVGVAVLLAGFAMLVLPGPGIIVLILGLAILATEFAWAERALDRTSSRASQAMVTISSSRAGRGGLALSGVALVVGGGSVMLVADRFWMAGIGLLIAGLIGLVTLHPRAQDWLVRRQQRD
jgi:uncharacterized protein (TIGR02611 family)